jgi:hypothetical protein
MASPSNGTYALPVGVRAQWAQARIARIPRRSGSGRRRNLLQRGIAATDTPIPAQLWITGHDGNLL